MKISEIIIDKYKLRIPPTVYYDLLADVVEAEEKQELMEKFESVKDHIFKLAGDYKCWDNRLTYDEALELCHILEQEPCDDCISRETARRIVDSGRTRQQMIDMVLATPSVNPQEQYYKELAESYEKTINKLTKAIAEQEPKIGHWGRKTKVDAYDIAGVKTWGIKCQCDRCDFTTIVVEDFGYYKYCPNCGAKMEGEGKE